MKGKGKVRVIIIGKSGDSESLVGTYISFGLNMKQIKDLIPNEDISNKERHTNCWLHTHRYGEIEYVLTLVYSYIVMYLFN